MALASVAAVVLLWLGRYHTFTAEEIDFLTRRPVLTDVLRPHNEHLSAVPILVYEVLVRLFGTGPYLPFLTVLTVLHVVAAAGLAAIVKGWSGVAAATIFLFLGSGYENLFWALQIGFVGSVAAGLWAMRTDRGWLAAALVGVGLASSGIGLVFILPVAVLQRRRAIWLALPIGAYLAWYAVYGVPPEHGGTVSQAAEWFLLGVGWAFGSLFGIGLSLGLGCALAALVLARRGDRTTSAAAIGLIALYALIALSRSGLEQVSFVAAPRYVYVAVPFILIGLNGIISDRRVLAALYGLAFVTNVLALPAGVAA